MFYLYLRSNISSSKTVNLKEKDFLGSLNPPLRKLRQAALKHVSMQQYILVSLRCILTGRWQIYNWRDTGYGDLMYVTPVAHYHAPWLWMPYLLKQCGVTVWEASCCSCSSWEWQEGRIVCDSNHCGSAPGLFLPPGSCCSSTLSKCTLCHLSACIPAPRGGGAGWRRNCGLGQESLYHFIWVSLAYHLIHNKRQMMLTEAGGWRDIPLVHPLFEHQLTSDESLIPRPWGQEVGLADKSHSSTRFSAASSHFASSLTFSIQRALIWNEGD